MLTNSSFPNNKILDMSKLTTTNCVLLNTLDIRLVFQRKENIVGKAKIAGLPPA